MQQIGNLIRYPVRWLGPFGILLLILAIAAVAYGLLRERGGRPPLPPGAQSVSSNINAQSVRQTTFRFSGTGADVHAFYRAELPKRGWRLCGSKTTPRCSNMIALAGGADRNVEVYRRAEDTNFTGTTIEVWPLENPGQLTFVTIFETRAP
jgi:hypothetical protein